MRDITVQAVENTVRDLCIEANRSLPRDVCRAIKEAAKKETEETARDVMNLAVENLRAAEETRLPVCQDTGMAVVFIRLGQDAHIVGGLLRDAVNRGVARGYTEGLLRRSTVKDPLRRVNTGDNAPCVLHLTLVGGDGMEITVAPKGFGSENMSRIKMFTPAAEREDIIDFIRETAERAGGNPCPPMILGVGIGGDFELCALLAKQALCRGLDVPNPDGYYAQMERDALRAVNALGIGPQGMGGNTTALGVAIETYPTHIAGLPVAVNVGCYVTRRASARL